MRQGYLLCLEGGGTRSQAVLMDCAGRVLQIAESSDVNTNFVPFQQAQQAVIKAVQGVLQATEITGEQVFLFASSLVGARFGSETFGDLCPRAVYRYYVERDVIFARAGIYRPHGIAVVAATGATAWGLRADDGREVAMGGWGALLGDEGSAYALGLAGLRAAVRSYEGRDPTPTHLVEAICQHFGLTSENFHRGLIRLAYQKPLSRAEIAGLAVVVTRLAVQNDPLAAFITAQTADDLAALALHAARRLFRPEEAFDMVIAGGLVEAGDLILSPLREGLTREFPKSTLKIGSEEPAVALGRLALHDYFVQEELC